MLYAITPTGGRPEGLALLFEYVAAQTYDGPLVWIIVDDCEPATRISRVRPGIDLEVVRPSWRWRAGMNTQAASLSTALALVPDDASLFVFEDDDIYLPAYCSTALRALEGADLVGERVSRYYNVRTRRWRALAGRFHASLASTACRGDALALFRRVCASSATMIDVTLWRTFDGAKSLRDTGDVIGIKGLPGRAGIGIGHREGFGTRDDGCTLSSWAGPYARNYDVFGEAA